MFEYLIFLTSQNDRQVFHRWLVEDFGPRLKSSPHCDELRVNVALDAVGGAVVDGNTAGHEEDFHATVELGCASESDFGLLMYNFREELTAVAKAHIYPMTRIVEQEGGETEATSTIDPYKVVTRLFFNDDLPRSARKRVWDQFSGMAKRGSGDSRYVRFWVEDPVTLHSPKISGVGILSVTDIASWKKDILLGEDYEPGISLDGSPSMEHTLPQVLVKEYLRK